MFRPLTAGVARQLQPGNPNRTIQGKRLTFLGSLVARVVTGRDLSFTERPAAPLLAAVSSLAVLSSAGRQVRAALPWNWGAVGELCLDRATGILLAEPPKRARVGAPVWITAPAARRAGP